MTTEEKAKAYDEALKKIQPLYEQAKKDDNPIWSTYEHLFPELRESECERVAKAIDEILKLGKAWEIAEKHGLTAGDIRVWLKKQKEQKPKNILTGKDTIQTAYCKGQTDVIEDPEAYGLCKPAEWSEEDKDYYDTIVRKLEVIGDDSGLSSNQIKFLREHCPLHRSEWSEEDETIIEGACSALEIHGHTKLASMLKSLRPQPQGTYKLIVHNIYEMLKDKDFFDITPSHRVSLLNDIRVKCKDADECAEILDVPSWKPSDEQMKALQMVRDSHYFMYQQDRMSIETLLEQLKAIQ